MKKYLLVTLILFSSISRSELRPFQDVELFDYALKKASRLSGLTIPADYKIPAIFYASKEELGKTVCPEDPSSCERLAAVFDDIEYRIIARDDFAFNNSFDDSFLIHELIHSLQYHHRGAEIFKDCQAIYNTEEQAYTAQDRYLKEEGAFFRASIALKFFYCDEEIAARDYEKSKAHQKNP